MLVVISPAKTLDFEPQTIISEFSKPALLADSKKLIQNLKKLSQKDIGKLMGISDKLAANVYDYVNSWKAKYDTKLAKQAVLAFRGDVYLGLELRNLQINSSISPNSICEYFLAFMEFCGP